MVEVRDTEEGMLSSRTKHIMRSKFLFILFIHKFCELKCLSHFAAPFIATREEASIAERCFDCKGMVVHSVPPSSLASVALLVKQAWLL